MKYFLITIDTECDASPDWRNASPLSFRSITDGIPGLLQPFFNRYGAVPTYLLTTQVLESNACLETLKSLDGKFELGTHLHPEFSSPSRKFEKPDGIRANDFSCQYDEKTEFLKLEAITNLFTEAFNKKPLVYRGGRFGAGPSTIRALEKLGYIADTSVTPNVKWQSSVLKIDYSKAPGQPYFPDNKRDISIKGKSGIIEFPVSTWKPFLHGERWLRPSPVIPFREIIKVLDSLEKQFHGDIFANMMFHSMEIIPDASPYCATANDVDNFMYTLGDILEEAINRGYRFTGLEEAARIFSPLPQCGLFPTDLKAQRQ
jgi:hypothetical protein